MKQTINVTEGYIISCIIAGETQENIKIEYSEVDKETAKMTVIFKIWKWFLKFLLTLKVTNIINLYLRIILPTVAILWQVILARLLKYKCNRITEISFSDWSHQHKMHQSELAHILYCLPSDNFNIIHKNSSPAKTLLNNLSISW